MAGELEENLWWARKKAVWRSWWCFYDDYRGLYRAITVPEFCQGYEPQNILNPDKLGLFSKALPEKGLADKKSKVKAEKNRNNEWKSCLLWQLMIFLFLNPLLFGDKKYHGMLDLSKIRQDQCLFIISEIAKHEWTVTSWELLLAD